MSLKNGSSPKSEKIWSRWDNKLVISTIIFSFTKKTREIDKKQNMNTTTTTSEINLTENFLNINLSDENNNSAQADDPEVNTSTNPGYFYQVEQLTFLWILFSLIVIGNATVLIALIVSKGRKSRMNFFIKHLAAADLCVGLISVLTDIIWKITISWEAGLIACKLISFLRAVVTYASTFVLVALSIDR